MQAIAIADRNAATVGGFQASQTPGANQIPVLDSSGNLLIGVTSASFTTITKNSASNYALGINNTANISNDSALRISMGANALSNASHIDCLTGGTIKLTVLGTGDVKNTNNSYGALSDLKLKENIIPARSYLEDLCKVNVVRYSLKDEKSATPTQLGVIAQELEQIFPGMVDESKDKAEREKLGENGEPVLDDGKPITEWYETGEVTKSVKYSIFVPMLITAIQELSAKVKELEVKLAAA